MIDFYTWNTSNGRKVAIAMEEMAVDYTIHPINIYKDEQFAPDFVSISANAKIPAIRDRTNGVTMFESGAILVYLAEKTGRYLPTTAAERATTLQWLMWQMGGFGPVLGQAAHFLHYRPGTSIYAADRFSSEAHRLYRVLNGRLAEVPYVAGDYTIADMAIWPWVTRFEHQQVDLTAFPHVARWYAALAARPCVQRGYGLLDDTAQPPCIAPARITA